MLLLCTGCGKCAKGRKNVHTQSRSGAQDKNTSVCACMILPRIKIEHSHENLTDSLARMGLASLFGPGRAQLFDMSDIPWLHVTNVVHKTSLDIKGPRVTAAGSAGGKAAAPPPNPSSRRREPAFVGPSEETIDVVLDRPFLYFVVDNVSGLVIAMGKVLNP